jgi:hypothetical protein
MAWTLDREISVGDILRVALPVIGFAVALALWIVDPWREWISYNVRPEVVSLKFTYSQNPDPDVPLQVTTTLEPSGKRKNLTAGKITWVLVLKTAGKITSEKAMTDNFPALDAPRAIALPEPVVIASGEESSTLEITATVTTRHTDAYSRSEEIILIRAPDRTSVSIANYTGVWIANFGDDLSETGTLRLLDRGPSQISGQMSLPSTIAQGEIVEVRGSRDHGFLQLKGELTNGCALTYTDKDLAADRTSGTIVSQAPITFDCTLEPIQVRFSAALLQ